MLNIILLTLIQATSFANILCEQDLTSLPALQGGRVKPYGVMADETIKYLTDTSKISSLSNEKVLCLLSFNKFSESLFFPVAHVKTQKLLNVTNKKIDANQALANKDLIRAQLMQLKLNDSYKKSLNKLLNRTMTYQKIINGDFWTIPQNSIVEGEQSKLEWLSISQFHNKVAPAQMGRALLNAKEAFIKLNGDRYLLEITLKKSRIFLIAMLIAIIGIFISVIKKDVKYAQFFAVAVLITEIIGMTLRVLISGRAPITNMYETVMFSGFGALFIAFVISFFKKDKLFIIAGLGYNIMCLFMMKFSFGMLDETISPLVPVLRDNFWLSTHVTTIILSYAALALSWFLANMILFKARFSTTSSKDLNYYHDLVYSCIKVGVILLSAGIILGGVWADYSWGRFWGWDPKETWSLIVLLFYMVILHGKSTSWISKKLFIQLSALGFLTVMFAWFGVNYILATGLHSYGFSEGGAIFLGGFFVVQIAILIITMTTRKEQLA